MSWSPAPEPRCEAEPEGAIDLVIDARERNIEGFGVGRVLPAPARRMIGPFAFFDHMGPASLDPGSGLDVRPHPHIGLATVTYLFEGEVVHRDSVGSLQTIRPGAINWMTAGSGIAHSERSPAGAREAGARLHGLQLWVALPRADEERAPSFSHHPAGSLPELDGEGVRARVLAGSAYGIASPVPTFSPLFYVEAHLERGARLELPREHADRAAYVVSGEVVCAGRALRARQMGAFERGAHPVIEATEASRVALIGGEPLDGPRYIWWNFVSSSKDRIVEAARAWKAGEWATVAGDELERVALELEPRFPRAE